MKKRGKTENHGQFLSICVCIARMQIQLKISMFSRRMAIINEQFEIDRNWIIRSIDCFFIPRKCALAIKYFKYLNIFDIQM